MNGVVTGGSRAYLCEFQDHTAEFKISLEAPAKWPFKHGGMNSGVASGRCSDHACPILREDDNCPAYYHGNYTPIHVNSEIRDGFL